MGIFMVPRIALLISFTCICVESHRPTIPSSVLSHAGLSIDHRHQSTLTKMDDFRATSPISPIILQPPSMTVAPASTDQHFQWWDNTSPELVQSGWYGFNRFTSRSARHLDKNSNRKARASYLLGESTQVQPLTNFKTHSQQRKYDEDLAIHEVLRELQRHIRPLPQRGQYIQPRIIMIDEAFGLPPGILVPVARPQQHHNIPLHATYRRPRKDIRRLASAPSPVTIKVVPLKISSVDIANALKTMSFVPIPLEFLNTEEKNSGGNSDISFDDKPTSDDEEDLPPPSSHVATPLDSPLGITYADTERTEHFISNYQPRK